MTWDYLHFRTPPNLLRFVALELLRPWFIPGSLQRCVRERAAEIASLKSAVSQLFGGSALTCLDATVILPQELSFYSNFGYRIRGWLNTFSLKI